MRLLLRLFTFLDVVSLVFMGMQLWRIAHHFNELLAHPEMLKAILKFPMFVLVLVGAIGLWSAKKIGFILYYIQFPFRFYLWVFSFAFITLFPEALNRYEDYWFENLLKVCMATELVRLFLTIKIHVKLKGQQSHL